MKRGFLKNEKKATSAASGQRNKGPQMPPAAASKITIRDLSSVDKNTKLKDLPKDTPCSIKASYGVVEGAGKPEGFEPAECVMAETDAARLDHPDHQILLTTIPSIFSDVSLHSEKERRDSWCDAVLDGATKRKIFSYPGFPKPVFETPTPLHRIAPAGEKGLGVFATRDIKESEIILAERPLLMVPSTAPLTEAHIPQHFTIEQLLQARMAEWEVTLQTLVQRMLPERREAFRALLNSHLHDGSGPIFGRVRTNGIAASARWRWMGYPGLTGHYTVVCDEISRINHSCRPNGSYVFDDASFSEIVYAVRDIKAGEEICISYGEPCKPYAERKKKLAPYGFECACAACTEHTISDARRARIQPYVGPDASKPPSTEIRRLLSQISLMDQEGLESLDQYLDSHFALTVVYIMSGNKAKGAKYKERMQQLAKRPGREGDQMLMTLQMASMMAR
ncbi:hypothetical protein HDZ31DRAFT_63048 [Schizophyllum fasciatum]